MRVRIVLTILCAVCLCPSNTFARGKTAYVVGKGIFNANEVIRQSTQQYKSIKDINRATCNAEQAARNAEKLSRQIREQTEKSRKLLEKLRTYTMPFPTELTLTPIASKRPLKNKVLANMDDADAKLCLEAAAEALADNDSLYHSYFIQLAKESTLTMDVITGLTSKQKKLLKNDVPDLVRFVVEKDYLMSLKEAAVGRCQIPPDIAKSESYINTCKSFAPEHLPLVKMTEAGDSTDYRLLKETVDSVIEHPKAFHSYTTDFILLNYTNAAYQQGNYDEMLKYFAVSPLKEYAYKDANVLLMLCNCLYSTREDDDALTAYLSRLEELNPDLAAEYNTQIYNYGVNYCIENPEDTLAIRDFIDSNPLLLDAIACDLLIGWAGKLPKEYEPMTDFEWRYIDGYPQKQPFYKVYRAILETSYYIDLDKVQNPEIANTIKIFRTSGLYFPEYHKQAKNDIAQLIDKLLSEPNFDKAVVANLCFEHAYAEGYGMDKPDKVVELLTKYEPIIADSGDKVSIVDTYNYLSQAYLKLGKKKQAKKYSQLAEKAMLTEII